MEAVLQLLYVMLQLNCHPAATTSVFQEDFQWGLWMLMWTSVYVDSNRVVMCDDLSQLISALSQTANLTSFNLKLIPSWWHFLAVLMLQSCFEDDSWLRLVSGQVPVTSDLNMIFIYDHNKAALVPRTTEKHENTNDCLGWFPMTLEVWHRLQEYSYMY